MRIIGLTGGIATGKSTVAGLLGARGAVIVDADRIAREVVEPGTPGQAAVTAAFGAAVLRGDGSIDRERLGAIVFGDAEQRRRLEAITHPLIRDVMASRIAEAMAQDPPLIAVDIPLLFESGRDADFPEVLLVATDAATQLRRLRERDDLDETAARQRLAAQLPIETKRGRATWVIDNSGTLDDTARQVAAFWDSTVGSVGNV
jgi:dephospho-CoA kinase